MDVVEVTSLLQETIWTALVLAAPILATALVTGLVISIFQAATQVNEQTLSFVPKIVLTLVVFGLTFPSLMTTLVAFTQRIVPAVTAGSPP